MKKFSLTLLALVASGLFLMAETPKFSLNVNENDHLQVFGPAGEKLAELTPGTIGKSISFGGAIFNASYGRDVNDRLSVILSPNLEKPAPLSFSVAGKSVETDGNAIVTLVYGADLKQVTIDAGYIGSVKVDGQKLNGQAVATDNSPARDKAPALAALPDVTDRRGEAMSEAQPEASGGEAGAGDFPITSGLGKTEQVEWAQDVSEVSMESAKADSVGQVRLVEVVGNVVVTDPAKGAKEVKATSGMVIPNGAQVTTKEKSTVAAIIGGIHSAQLVPGTETSFEQKMVGNVCDTEVKLNKGSVFVKVNKRPGEKQDFKVRTPVGVAAAKGSGAMVSYKNKRMLVAASESRWKISDGNGGFFVVSPMFSKNKKGGFTSALGFASIPQTGGAELMEKMKESLKEGGVLNKLLVILGEKINEGRKGSKLVIHESVSLLAGNSTTMKDGTPNPNRGLEGDLRKLAGDLVGVLGGFEETQGKDDPETPFDNSIGNPLIKRDSVFALLNLNLTAKQTTPGGN